MFAPLLEAPGVEFRTTAFPIISIGMYIISLVLVFVRFAPSDSQELWLVLPC